MTTMSTFLFFPAVVVAVFKLKPDFVSDIGALTDDRNAAGAY